MIPSLQSRGTAGFDQSGRGYYWSSMLDRCNGPCDRPPYDDRNHPPPQAAPPSHGRPPYDSHYSQSHQQRPPPPPHQNSLHSQYNSNSQDQYPPQHTTPSILPEYYRGKPASSAAQSAEHTHKVSSNTIGVEQGSGSGDRWSPNNSSSNSSNKSDSNNKDLDDKEKER